MRGIVKRTVAQRVAGDKPSPPRAALVAAVSGVAAATITYKVMRS